MTPEQAQTYCFDPFDITKVWFHGDFPLIPVGKIVLNRNPENYFAEVEQAAFSPANVVPGIAASPGKMLQAVQLSQHPPPSPRTKLPRVACEPGQGMSDAQLPAGRIHAF
jgi:hypothetical protein